MREGNQVVGMEVDDYGHGVLRRCKSRWSWQACRLGSGWLDRASTQAGIH